MLLLYLWELSVDIRQKGNVRWSTISVVYDDLSSSTSRYTYRLDMLSAEPELVVYVFVPIHLLLMETRR